MSLVVDEFLLNLLGVSGAASTVQMIAIAAIVTLTFANILGARVGAQASNVVPATATASSRLHGAADPVRALLLAWRALLADLGSPLHLAPAGDGTAVDLIGVSDIALTAGQTPENLRAADDAAIAVKRGVDVRVILPATDATDNAIVQHASTQVLDDGGRGPSAEVEEQADGGLDVHVRRLLHPMADRADVGVHAFGEAGAEVVVAFELETQADQFAEPVLGAGREVREGDALALENTLARGAAPSA